MMITCFALVVNIPFSIPGSMIENAWIGLNNYVTTEGKEYEAGAYSVASEFYEMAKV